MSSYITAAAITAAATKYASDQADTASKRSKKWQHRALDIQEQQYEQTREDWAPWREVGVKAINRLEDPDAFQASPAFNFIRDEGMRGIENRYSVKGGGGNAMRALAEFSNNLAATEYWNWRNDQRAMAGLGTTGNAQSQQAGQWYGNAFQNVADNMGSLEMYNAQQKGQAAQSYGNALAYGITGAAGAFRPRGGVADGGTSNGLTWFKQNNKNNASPRTVGGWYQAPGTYPYPYPEANT